VTQIRDSRAFSGIGSAAEQPANRRLRPGDGPVAALNHALIVVPMLVTLAAFLVYSARHQLAFDFHYAFWVAGSRIRHGMDPYFWTRHQIENQIAFPYPAPGALLFVPISLIGRGVGGVAFAALTLAAGLSALRILGVRDWRLYTFVLLLAPVVSGWGSANLTLLLVCGVAATWRYRDSPIMAGVLAGLMLAVKPVVWPLLLWLLVTRRRRAAGYGLALAIVVNVISWLVLGLGELSSWWHLLQLQTSVLYRDGYTLTALAVHLGAQRSVGTALQIAVTALIALACFGLGRHGRERDALTLAIVLVLASSPQVDIHYFAYLVVPLALARPALSPIWLPQLVLWLCPANRVSGVQWLVAWAVLIAVLVPLLLDPAGPSRRAAAVVVKPQ
jgi:alpha-1,2-mannosyltransferase